MSDLGLPWSYDLALGHIRDNAGNTVIESVNPFYGKKIVVAMNTKALCDEIIAYDAGKEAEARSLYLDEFFSAVEKMSRDVANKLAKLAEEMKAGTI